MIRLKDDYFVFLSSNSNKSWLNDEFGSPGEGFQGFAEDDFEKTPNGSAKFDGKVSFKI